MVFLWHGRGVRVSVVITGRKPAACCACGMGLCRTVFLSTVKCEHGETVPTDNGREYCGTEAHSYELYLKLSDIEHRTTAVRRPQNNSFVERFLRTVKEEFIPQSFCKRIYMSLEDFDRWFEHCNSVRPIEVTEILVANCMRQ